MAYCQDVKYAAKTSGVEDAPLFYNGAESICVTADDLKAAVAQLKALVDGFCPKKREEDQLMLCRVKEVGEVYEK